MINSNYRLLTQVLVLTLFLFVNSCKKDEDIVSVSGCTDPASANYNPDATVNDGSCIHNNVCLEPAEFSELTYEQKGDNVLKYTINFKTSETIQARLVAIRTGSADSIITRWTVAGTDHKIILVGLRAESAYKFRVETREAGCIKVADEDFEITTGSLPAGLLNYEVNAGSSIATSGFVLCNVMDITKFTGGLTSFYQPYIIILDREGYVIWYHYYGDYVPVSFSITPFNSVLAFAVSPDVSERFIIEVNLEGDVLMNLPLSAIGVDGIVHHEIEMDNQGNITALFTEQRFIDRSSIGGSSNANLIGDKIIKINGQGSILWEWSTFDVFDPLVLTGEEGFYDFIYGAGTEDWLHTNAFTYDKDGHIIISLPLHNFLAKINKDNGTLIWTLGESGSLNIGSELHIYNQHRITVLPGGNYLLYDNGDDNLRPYSRVIEFSVNESNGAASLVKEAILPSNNSSDYESSAVRLGDGNTLVSSTFAINKLFELNSSGQIIWSLNTKGLMMYRAYHVASLYNLALIQ